MLSDTMVQLQIPRQRLLSLANIVEEFVQDQINLGRMQTRLDNELLHDASQLAQYLRLRLSETAPTYRGLKDESPDH